jgi:hypothetical protein
LPITGNTYRPAAVDPAAEGDEDGAGDRAEDADGDPTGSGAAATGVGVGTAAEVALGEDDEPQPDSTNKASTTANGRRDIPATVPDAAWTATTPRAPGVSGRS